MPSRVNPLAQQGEVVVEWPHEIVSTGAENDLGPPLSQLLVDLGLKGSEKDQADASKTSAAFTGTPTGVAIIEAGATAASKGWATAVAALGGGTVIWGAVSGFWKSEPKIQGTLAIAAAVVIAACALGVALIMYGDVRARGQGAAAQYRARATIASAFLQGAGRHPMEGLTAAQTNAVSGDGAMAAAESAQLLRCATTADVNDLRARLLALLIAQSGANPVPVVLKSGGHGFAKNVILAPTGEFRFQLNGTTWMPVSEIAALGEQ